MTYRFILLLVLTSLMIFVAGCGGDEPDPEPITEEPALDTTVTQPQVQEEPKYQNPTFRKKGYAVQIGSFREYDNARDLAIKFSNRGYTTYIEDVEVIGEGIYHRVRIGSYRTSGQAHKIGREVRTKYGVRYWVDKD
ncbi:MAG: hypothetical protein GF315_01090 [candidate division Zixibacteria bacterium]|nr:hypothetical protein [candidate division Zixibacteria bacterium]